MDQSEENSKSVTLVPRKPLITSPRWSCLFILLISSALAVFLVVQYSGLSPAHLPAFMSAGSAPMKGNTEKGNNFFQAAVINTNLSMLPPLPTVPPKIRHLFTNQLSNNDTNILSEEMQVFHQIMTKASLTYFLYKGSLLGSYRHHALIPWDDDLDIIAPFEDKAKIKAAFKKAPKEYVLDTKGVRYKLYSKFGHSIKRWSWKSPFLDVSFYKQNKTHLWDVTIPSQAPYPKADIFPLTPRPLLGNMYPSPRDPYRTLKLNYDLDVCYTGTYNHMAERRKSPKSVGEVSCSALINSVPFVRHIRGPGGAWCKEVLTFKGEVVDTFVRSSKNIPVC